VTLPFDQKRLQPEPSNLFVLVHPSSHAKRPSLADGDAAGTLAHCRAALAHARGINMAVAFMAAWPKKFRIEMGWINGLEPGGRDMVFRRTDPSCYASRYFAEAADSYRTLVIAGFLNASGCVATVIDALRAGHNAIFLRDAIAVARHEGVPAAGLKNSTGGRISISDTAAWKAATGPASAPRTILSSAATSRDEFQ
jgi:nicotinamidase-related amidase